MTQNGIWPSVLKLFCASRRPFRWKGLYTSLADIIQTTSDENILMINSNQGKNTMCKKRQALILLLFDCTHETFTSWWCQRQIVAFIVVWVQGPGRGEKKTNNTSCHSITTRPVTRWLDFRTHSRLADYSWAWSQFTGVQHHDVVGLTEPISPRWSCDPRQQSHHLIPTNRVQ